MNKLVLLSSHLFNTVRKPASYLGLLFLLVAAFIAVPGASASSAGFMVTPRSYHTATLLADGRVLVAAGYTQNVAPYVINKAEYYDPGTNSWQATGDLNIARNPHSAVLLPNDRVLVAGGSDYNGSPLNGAELYDPVTGQWTLTGSLNQERTTFGMVLLPNGKVLAAGGSTSTGSTATAELYDPATGTWSFTGTMSQEHGPPLSRCLILAKSSLPAAFRHQPPSYTIRPRVTGLPQGAWREAVSTKPRHYWPTGA